MGEYFIKNEEGDLDPLRPANVEDITLIESNVGAAFVQFGIDNEGVAYILDENPDAFSLYPVDDVIDQQNAVGSSWQDLQDLHVKQIINVNKSSIQKIRLRFRNTSTTQSINVSMEIRDLNNQNLGSYTLTIPANQPETEYSIPFDIHHLPQGEYYLKIKRTNVDGVRVKYDANGGYCSGMFFSPDDSNYNPMGGDLWFKHEYATQSTFDVISGLAVIQGFKTYNLDTHVTIPPASSYGDRIDLVVMRRDGILEVISGVAGSHPIEPEAPYGMLKIAYVTVFKNSPLAVNMEVDQERELDRTRPLNLLQKVRELEREMVYVMDKNSPERIKYNLSGEGIMDPGASTNMVYDGELGTCILSSNEIVRRTWSFKDDSNFTVSNIDHSDHTNGTIRLATTLYQENTFMAGHGNSSRAVSSRKCFVYKNRSQMSRYPAGFFRVSTGGYIAQINVQPFWHLGTISGGRLYLMRGNTIVQESDYLPVNQWSTQNWVPNQFKFSGTVWLTPGDYYWVLKVDPVSSSSPAKLWIDTWYSYDPNYYSVNNTYGEFIGWYPNMSPSGYTGNGIALATRPGRGIGFDIIQNVPGFVSNGNVTSSSLATGAGIATVMVDLNINIPDGTYYKLEVSNDGGTTFYQMTGLTYTFSNQSGQSFVWRLTFYTNDRSKTPEVYFDYAKQYAVKFTLGLTGGSPPTSGQLVTKAFDGPRIVQFALGYAQTANPTESVIIDKFSNWDWLRMWIQENAGEVSIDLESSMDGVAWRSIKSGLSIDEMPHKPTLYGESIDIDEYNYWCDLNVDILTDEEIVETCETPWTSAQGAEVTCTADTSNKTQGTASAKMAMTADATTGLLAYVSKACSIRNYDWIEVYFYSSIALNDGDMKFRICSDTEGSVVLEEYDVPALSATTWTPFKFKLNNPALLGEVKSFGIEQIVDKGAFNLYVDSIKAIKMGLTILEPCDIAWTPDKTDPGLIHVSKDSSIKMDSTYSSKMVINADPGTGLMMHIPKTPGLNLSIFKQIRIWFYSTINLEQGDYSLLIGGNTTCTTILEEHELPAMTANGWTRITIDLDEPRSLSSVRAFGLKLNNNAINAGSFYIDSIQGLTTTDMPFYQPYVRMRFNLSRNDGKDISPSIRKVGVIPRFS